MCIRDRYSKTAVKEGPNQLSKSEIIGRSIALRDVYKRQLFTITEEEYEQIHSTWSKAIKVLPVYSIVHKQDWYTTETYRCLLYTSRCV